MRWHARFDGLRAENLPPGRLPFWRLPVRLALNATQFHPASRWTPRDSSSSPSDSSYSSWNDDACYHRLASLACPENCADTFPLSLARCRQYRLGSASILLASCWHFASQGNPTAVRRSGKAVAASRLGFAAGRHNLGFDPPLPKCYKSTTSERLCRASRVPARSTAANDARRSGFRFRSHPQNGAFL